jgi:hypothetical protein
MTKPLAQPPRLAVWLVNLFTPYEQAESIPGDLLEEFSAVASRSGVASARRYYWRHSLRTIAALIGAGFRDAPGTITVAVSTGFLLLVFGSAMPERIVVAILRTQRPYSNTHVQAYMLFLTWGMLVAGFVESLIIGCIVAVVAKGRETLATMTLFLILSELTAWGLLHLGERWPENANLLRFLISRFDSDCMILIGGGIVRRIRSAASTRRLARDS